MQGWNMATWDLCERMESFMRAGFAGLRPWARCLGPVNAKVGRDVAK